MHALLRPSGDATLHERPELAKAALRLQIVEHALRTFLLTTLAAAVAMPLTEPSFTIQQMLASFVPFLVPNIFCLWLTRRGYVRQAAWLYTVTVAVLQGSSVLFIGEVPVHTMLSLVNLVLLIGISVGAAPALVVTTIPTALLAFGTWLTDGTPVFEAPLPPLTDSLMFVASTSTLICTGFVTAFALRIIWTHIDRSADTMAALQDARDDLAERHQRAVALTEFSRSMLSYKDGTSPADPLLDAVLTIPEAQAALVMDSSFEVLASRGQIGSSLDELRPLLVAQPGNSQGRPVEITVGGQSLYALRLGASETPQGFLVIATVDGKPLTDRSAVFIVAASHIMTAAALRIISEERYRRTQRMETLGQFTGGIAHDFNNLLTTILGSTEIALLLLEEPERPQAELTNHMEMTRTGALQASALVDRLLAFAKQANRERTLFDLYEYVRSQEEFLSRSCGEDIEVTFQYPDENGWVLADPIEVQQVLLNLLANARIALGGEGRIDVSLAQDEAGKARLCVSDSGPGVPVEDRARIFEAFYTTRSQGRGLGLGLATVASILDNAGGSISVSDSDLGGAAFIVHWPLTSDARPEGEGTHLRSAALERPVRVLVVDDDELVREILANMLSQLGHTVVEADSTDSALIALQEDRGIEIVLTDLMMPVRSGAELIEAMRAQGDRRPAILVTGYDRERLLGDESAPLADARLGKPVTIDELRMALERALAPATNQASARETPETTALREAAGGE